MLPLYRIYLHPQVVPHCGTIRRVLSLFLEILLIVPHPRIVPHHTLTGVSGVPIPVVSISISLFVIQLLLVAICFVIQLLVVVICFLLCCNLFVFVTNLFLFVFCMFCVWGEHFCRQCLLCTHVSLTKIDNLI